MQQASNQPAALRRALPEMARARRCWRRWCHGIFAAVAIAGLAGWGAARAASVQTEQLYLSGKGPKDAVPWEFTVTGGRQANVKTTIPVPSHWEQQGFGTLNYGDDKSPHATEHGLYRVKFTPPADWKGRRIKLVFGGVMTDATVKVNGEQVGPTHVGGYSPFSYDVTKWARPGAENVLEVDVAKTSSNPSTDRAERHVDFWIFGGIYRPVYLESTPAEFIAHTAIDARADGSLTADVRLVAAQTATRLEGQVTTLAGEPVGRPFSVHPPAGGGGSPSRLSTRIDSPKLWNAETPNLYLLRVNLYRGDEVIHTTTTRFGFRTFEVRPGKGLYVNGQRVLLKGVNIMAFRPDSGRALDRAQNYEDARLIKSMNMNAVRMSMFPQDPAFMDAADELGLYAINEMTSWQHGHDTFVGRQLVRELVERDVNHPSVIFWTNGNEGGWNRDLDGEFSLYDPQKRRVLHPWEVHDDTDTYHYPSYAALTARLAGKHVYFPTEVLHGLFDGGGGAGLEDYWNAMRSSPVGGGMFLWSLADEGLARTDRKGAIDLFGTYAGDGLVGPHHQKEGSYYTVRDLWSPVQIETPRLGPAFDGALKVSNGYDFTPLSKVTFEWQLIRFAGAQDSGTAPTVLRAGQTRGPDLAPHGAGTVKLELPRDFGATLARADALTLSAIGPGGEALWTWTWPVADPVLPPTSSGAKPLVSSSDGEIRMSVGATSATFDAASGLLKTLARGKQAAALQHGPRLVYAKPSRLKDRDPYGRVAPDPSEKPFDIPWTALAPKPDAHMLPAPQMANLVQVVLDMDKSDSYAQFKLEITPDGKTWKTLFDSTRRAIDGERYTLAPQLVAGLRISQPTSDAGRPIAIKSLKLGFESERFPAPAGPARITSGVGADEAWIEAEGAGGIDHVRWTLRRDGSLKLDYRYALSGDYVYHGVSFDQPQDGLVSMKRLAGGPSRVWQNRLRGAELMVTQVPYRLDQPGQIQYPEFQGYFSKLRWARFDTRTGPLLISSATPELFLRVGTPLLGHGTTSVEYPAGDLSFLAAIPAVGSKIVTVENTGPASQPAKASGTYQASLLFTLPQK